MNMIKKALSIAGIKIGVESEVDFTFSDRCIPFTEEVEQEDVVFRIRKTKSWDLDGYSVLSEAKKTKLLCKGNEEVKVKYSDENKKEVSWYMTEENGTPFLYNVYVLEEKVLKFFNPLIFVDLSEFLIHFEAMVLHSSLINYQGHGIVFTAPSGTGKSTQADLWRDNLGAKILNGDRSIIRKENLYYAYGSPYSGSSHIYENESVPLKAIVVLRQAKENRLRKMSMKEAYLCLLSEMSISSGKKEIIEKQSQWLLEMLQKIPVYMLECLPNQGAAEILYDELKEKFHEGQ